MENRSGPSETGRDARWWRFGGTLMIVAAVIGAIAGNTGFAVAFVAIGGAMIVLAPALP